MEQTATILVIDADNNARQLISDTLRDAGFGVVDWPELGDLDEVGSIDCCLLVIDVELPGWQGIQIIQKLRNHLATKYLPIVICTGLDDDTDIINGLDAGADDYIIKPFSPNALAARLRSIVRRRNPNLRIG